MTKRANEAYLSIKQRSLHAGKCFFQVLMELPLPGWPATAVGVLVLFSVLSPHASCPLLLVCSRTSENLLLLFPQPTAPQNNGKMSFPVQIGLAVLYWLPTSHDVLVLFSLFSPNTSCLKQEDFSGTLFFLSTHPITPQNEEILKIHHN